MLCGRPWFHLQLQLGGAVVTFCPLENPRWLTHKTHGVAMIRRELDMVEHFKMDENTVHHAYQWKLQWSFILTFSLKERGIS